MSHIFLEEMRTSSESCDTRLTLLFSKIVIFVAAFNKVWFSLYRGFQLNEVKEPPTPKGGGGYDVTRLMKKSYDYKSLLELSVNLKCLLYCGFSDLLITSRL
jgi:hypothetical protein